MLSKNKAQFIKSLQLKKHREESGRFTIEGKKSVLELLNSLFQVRTIVCTQPFWLENKDFLKAKKIDPVLCSPSELESISLLKTNISVLAVADIKQFTVPQKLQGLTLALDSVRDPGNLGTILRIADWFGMGDILVSEDTTDFYNPKTLQSSMGSFCRVAAHYVKLDKYLQSVDLPIYAARLKGRNIHSFSFKKDCVVLLGNESHGISSSILPLISETISIPGSGKAESLNVATAAAILCDNYFRLNHS